MPCVSSFDERISVGDRVTLKSADGTKVYTIEALSHCGKYAWLRDPGDSLVTTRIEWVVKEKPISIGDRVTTVDGCGTYEVLYRLGEWLWLRSLTYASSKPVTEHKDKVRRKV